MRSLLSKHQYSNVSNVSSCNADSKYSVCKALLIFLDVIVFLDVLVFVDIAKKMMKFALLLGLLKSKRI